jgi:hypothetical protein
MFDEESPISFVAWSKNVPDKMVTNPQSSVIISAALCWSQSLNIMALARIVSDVNIT